MCTDAWVVAGAKVGLCELPRALISSDDKGGTGGTCVLRGYVPKKLMALAGLFTEDVQDATSFGCAMKLPELMNSPLSVTLLLPKNLFLCILFMFRACNNQCPSLMGTLTLFSCATNSAAFVTGGR